MNAPLAPSAYLLPSLYISAGGQNFVIPTEIAYVQIATTPERSHIRPEPWGEPLRSDNFIQLLFRAPQPAGMLLQRLHGPHWYLLPYDQITLKTPGGAQQIRQDGDWGSGRYYPLMAGAHVFALGDEEIGIMVPPRPAWLVEGAIGSYAFLSAYERAKIRKEMGPALFVAPPEIETQPRAYAHYVLSTEIYTRQPSTRLGNCLQNANIRWVGELVLQTEKDLLKVKNMGPKSIDEVKSILADFSEETCVPLFLGMLPEQLHGWRPPQG